MYLKKIKIWIMRDMWFSFSFKRKPEKCESKHGCFYQLFISLETETLAHSSLQNSSTSLRSDKEMS